MLGNRKKIAKFLMRTFTCRSTFLYALAVLYAMVVEYCVPTDMLWWALQCAAIGEWNVPFNFFDISQMILPLETTHGYSQAVEEAPRMVYSEAD